MQGANACGDTSRLWWDEGVRQTRLRQATRSFLRRYNRVSVTCLDIDVHGCCLPADGPAVVLAMTASRQLQLTFCLSTAPSIFDRPAVHSCLSGHSYVLTYASYYVHVLQARPNQDSRLRLCRSLRSEESGRTAAPYLPGQHTTIHARENDCLHAHGSTSKLIADLSIS
ncbi:hypothetical protein BU25DRAFT_181914 [Macroventuria anomochaeta]|uniref:Uncharacterized protein n=1 Tax=Macroventuria anomochaeta TaxID=301207 RepID=A0ACB6RNB7_9PLEO|nr:uncharacterized protein BU25DRAFT_181914 [Macroventuria anomochaeta]KAF2623298.1 hypothetical protein BU25DRAFT_181914 [Macroventuria anomochaeta]